MGQDGEIQACGAQSLQHWIQPAGEAEKKAVWNGLKEYNSQYFTDREDLSQCVKDSQGQVIAGIVAWREFACVEVEFLWVSQQHRKSGLGSRLLGRVEELARQQGASVVVLNTFGFQAPQFYPKHGYHCFGTVEEVFGGYSWYFFRKEL